MSYIPKLIPNDIFGLIINFMDDVMTITNLKNALPEYNDIINKYLIHFAAIKEIAHVNFMDYSTAHGLVYAEARILFDIKSPSEFTEFKKFYRIKYINFYIKKEEIDEFETLEYLEGLLKNLPGGNFKDKIIKLIFYTHKTHYAYVIDYNTVMIANFNQYRHITDNKFVGRIEWRYEFIRLLERYFKSYAFYECVYSKYSTQNNKGRGKFEGELFKRNIVDTLPDKSIILYTKLDDDTEIYQSNSSLENFIKKAKFKLGKADLSTMTYFTKEILSLLLYKYCKDAHLFVVKGEVLYVKFWDDPLLSSLIPCTKDDIKDIDDQDVRVLIRQLNRNKITMDNLSNILCNLFQPIDFMELEQVVELVMLPKRQYYAGNPHKEVLKFITTKLRKLFD